MNKQFKLTKEGLEELKKEMSNLVSGRSEVAQNIKTAREFGDLSENAEYSAAKHDQDQKETRISEIEHILKNADVMSAPKNKDVIELGNVVTLTGPKGEKTFTIVDPVEVDPMSGKISNESPIGRVILGKKLGEEVEINTPSSTIKYSISKIA